MATKRSQGPRAPSPTPTAFSGISNYRTDSYRPIRDKNVPAVPTIDYRLVSKTHFDELSSYLAVYLANAPANSRSTARQKLTRLTIQQFHELSTDVYDELVRRKNEKAVPFLPVREEFHPKRNQARQKLATLPASRFEDLSSDVYYELARRYPEFKEDPSGEQSPSSNYDDYPSPDFPKSTRSPPPRAGRVSEDRPGDSGYGGSRRPSEDRRRPSEQYDPNMSGRRSEASEDAYGASRRKPSQDVNVPPPRKSDEREREYDYARRPSGASASGTSDSASTANAQSATAASGMIIPNKSTITEEDIEVPYGRDARESGSTTTDELERGRDRSRDTRSGGEVDLDAEPDSASDYLGPRSPRSPLVGLSGLTARLRSADDDEDEGAASGPGNRSGDDYYDKMSFGRASVNSERSGGGSRAPGGPGRTSVTGEDQEKLRREYEYKIATMQTQITNLQRDLEDAEDRDRKWEDGEARVRQMEEELVELRRRTDEQSSAMRAMEKELEELRELRARDQEREARRAREDEEELQILRDRCDTLEEERQNSQGGADSEMMDQLRSDMESLMSELGDLSRRNDELMTAKDADLVVIRDLDNQLKEYKRKYELAKTELRNVKATSQLFLQAPKSDDQLPVAPDGGILDIHVTAFLSSIDALLTAGRSNAPTRVLTPMKAVVNAVSAIIDDVRTFESRPHRDRSDVDVEALRSLRERAEATLSNLVAASKTHATSSGMSPVSLLDAAASHVSATVTEIGRTVCIRRASKAEQEQFSPPANAAGASATQGFAPALRSVEEARGSHSRKASAASTGRSGGTRLTETTPTTPLRSSTESRRPPPSEHSSSDTNSPPPIFDQSSAHGGVFSDDSAQGDNSEDAWTELKPYLEAQTESIVYAIQSVLSGVRSPTPSPTLNENLTQIITIVSSIVAVCNDHLPPASAQQGKEILQELSDHANKLSEVQALPEVTKESRQIMAKSSFAVANAMKGLMKL